MKIWIWIITLICLFPVNHLIAKGPEKVTVSLPDIKRVSLKPYSTFKFPQIFESSGIVKSRVYQDVYWTHNDSGDIPRIFPVTGEGDIVKPRFALLYNGIIIHNAKNNDWEDITVDNKGNLLIGDIGNNNNGRKNFRIYIIREPSPFDLVKVKVSQEILFYYPDKKDSKSKIDNINAEAIFWASDKVYILNKLSKGKYTDLYCLESFDQDKSNPLSLKGSFNFHGRVTGADATIDGRRLVVLTYKGIWLFETKDSGTDYFHGRISWLPISAGQCEGISIDNEEIIISNESRKLFKVSVRDLIVIKE